MRLPRPHIPISVRCNVAVRQLLSQGVNVFQHSRRDKETLSAFLARLLVLLADKLGCAVSDLHLDHDPALVNREKLIELETGRHVRAIIVPKGGKVLRYFPDANDQDHLRYRPKPADAEHSHDIKTRVRGDHGQLSDLALARKEKRRVDKLTRKQRSTWPTGRKIPSRPLRRIGK